MDIEHSQKIETELEDSTQSSIEPEKKRTYATKAKQLTPVGTKVKRSYLDRDGKTKSSPFKYTNKQPPSRIIDKWIVRKGIAPRDEKGRFMPRKSISFLIARSIKSKGIQGISFFQKPMMLGMKTFSKKFGKAIAEDIINNIK